MLINFKNIALVAVVGLGLSACAGQDYFMAKETTAPSDAYTAALYKDTMALADFERVEEDWASADYYGARALTVANGGSIAPTDPSTRDLNMYGNSGVPKNEQQAAYAALNNVLSEGAAKKDPMTAAKAFAGYECMIEQSEEGHQVDHIAACKKQYDDAMAILTKPEPMAMVSGGPWMVYFPTNVDSVDADSMMAIDMAAQAASQGGTLVLRGYADSVGSPEYNMDLSKRRSISVADLLNAKGVDQDNMNVGYVGETEQLVETADGVAEQGNRVVVMRLIP